jgi:rare lipoprotein A
MKLGEEYCMFARNVTWSVIAIGLVLSSCTKKPTPAPASSSAEETGVASWYGHPFDGRLTANGEIYDMEKMTAAHRTLPFGTVLRVHNQTNSQTTEVRINDRGPFVQGRIIDLSHAAAQAITMPGVANVRLEIISMPRTRAPDVFAVQIGSFSQRAGAEQLRKQMEGQYGSAKLVFRDGDQTWRVLVGTLPTVESANALAQQLDKGNEPGFVVLLDPE